MNMCLYGFCASLESNICMANLANRHLSLFQMKWGPICRFDRASATGLACRQGTLTPPDTWSRPFGTCIYSTCRDQSFSELVVSLPDYALRISLGTFSILLVIVQHLWCRTIREIIWRVPGEWVKSKFLCQDVAVISLADKCLVVGCFVFGTMTKFSRKRESSLTKSGSLKTDSCLVLTECFSSRILRFRSRWSTCSTPKECQLRRLLSLPTVWHILHKHPL